MILAEGVCIGFGQVNNRHEVLRDVTFRIEPGEIVSLVGANGSGKSTLLRLIAGTLAPDRGSISFSLRNNEDPHIGFVHQRYREALFPWRNVHDNISLAFENRCIQPAPDENIDQLVDGVMGRLGIRELSRRRPAGLSGGEAQLVAVARALVHPRVKILLLDEPFSALDGRNMKKAAAEILKITRKNEMSTLLITHDLDVGILFGDRIAVLTAESKGIAAVIDAPTESECRFDPDFLVDKRFIECKKEVLRAQYPLGGQ